MVQQTDAVVTAEEKNEEVVSESVQTFGRKPACSLHVSQSSLPGSLPNPAEAVFSAPGRVVPSLEELRRRAMARRSHALQPG